MIRVYWCGTPLAGCRTTVLNVARVVVPSFEPGNTPYSTYGGWLVSTGEQRDILCLREQVRASEHYEVISDMITRPEYAEQAAFLSKTDAIVFVVDSQRTRRVANEYYFSRLRRDLNAVSRDLEAIPLILQLNKRDLPDVEEVDILAARHQTSLSVACATIGTLGMGLMDLLARLPR